MYPISSSHSSMAILTMSEIEPVLGDDAPDIAEPVVGRDVVRQVTEPRDQQSHQDQVEDDGEEEGEAQDQRAVAPKRRQHGAPAGLIVAGSDAAPRVRR